MMTSPKAVNSGQTEREAWDVALDALDDYQRNWDTGLPAEYASGERIAMECAVEAVREALQDARSASFPPLSRDELIEHTAREIELSQARAASTATAMLDVLHDSNRENDRAWSAENRVARAAAPQGLTDEHAEALYRLARMTDFAGWVKEFRQSAEQSAAPMAVTLDRSDLFDFVRDGIKSALEAGNAGEGMTPSWYWQEATERTERVLGNLGLFDTIPRASEQADEAVKLTAYDADMFWPEHDGEQMYHSLDDAVTAAFEDSGADAGDTFTFTCAARLPKVTVRIIEVTENGFEWEEIDRTKEPQ